jgi:hypothetical protein
MDSLLTAIMTKFSGSTLSTYVGGRIYLDQAPQSVVFPYVIFSIVASNPEDTFKNKIEDTLVQFSLFSTSLAATEITTMYGYLKAILDDAILTVTGHSHIWMIRENLVTMVDDISASQDGSEFAKHWAVDYSIKVQE